MRPISSGAKSRVKAAPMASAPVAGASVWLTDTMTKCGESPPSVPPDMTIATRAATASGVVARRPASITDSACTA